MLNSTPSQHPIFNPRFIAAGRRSWSKFSPASVVVIDHEGEYFALHQSEVLTLPDGHSLSMKETYDKARLEFNVGAAQAFVKKILDQFPDKIDELKNKFGKNPPLILWESADPFFDNPRNALPVAYAQALAEKLGWQCASDLAMRKRNPSGRKGLQGMERLVKQPFYSGEIKPGQNYLLIEDHINGGSTVANMNSFVEEQGGHVVGISVLNGNGYRTKTDRRKQVRLRPAEQDFSRVVMYIGKDNLSDLDYAFFGPLEKESEKLKSRYDLEKCRFTASELGLIEKYAEKCLEKYIEDQPKINVSMTLAGGKQYVTLSPDGQNLIFHKLVDAIAPLAAERADELFATLTGGVPRARTESEIGRLQKKIKDLEKEPVADNSQRESILESQNLQKKESGRRVDDFTPVRPSYADMTKNAGRIPVLGKKDRLVPSGR